MEPNIKLGTYGAATDTVGTGIIRSLALGFVPDMIDIMGLTTGTKIYRAFPSRTSFSNGTAVRISSTLGAVGAAGNNHATDTNPGSYVMAMGGPNDVSTSTKQKGVYLGKKLNTQANYFYMAYRVGAGGNITSK